MNDNALYLEADEDITSAIDKLSKAPAGPVQIVVPKRSTMLQSIINLKLLKKAADGGKRELVLVTSDRVATDLAARVGLAVAPTLGGKAVKAQPKAAPTVNTDDEVIEATDPVPPADPLAQTGLPPAPAAKPKRLSFQRRPVAEDAAPVPATGAKLPRIPNYRKLQRRIFWLFTAVFLVAGVWAFMYFTTSAKVVLYANANRTSVDTTFAVDPNATASDTAGGTLAGQVVTFSKDLNGPVTPTGKQDVGTKAAGTITVTNATGVDQPLVAGTRFQAPDGKIFRSNADTTVPKAYLDSGGDKVNGSATVAVTADQNGDGYNEGPTTYTILALGNPKIVATGGQMSGGTTKTVTIVTQADVDAAVSALIDKDKDASARDLSGKTVSGYMALPSSQTSKTSDVTATPAVNAQADTANVSFKVTYTMLTVKQDDFKTAVRALETKQVGPTGQIYDDGLAAAQITVTNTDAAGRTSFHFATDAYSGTKIDLAALAKSLGGKRYGDAMDLANRQPGVSHAEISLSPGWASSLPSRTDKITVSIKVASVQK
ncbi:MAG TPA: hypothetical protein VI322_04000 [Candidatus Saccharimonadia bacterium]